MHAQPNDSPHPGEPIYAHDRRDSGIEPSHTQSAILALLLGEDHHGLWARDELQRALSADALSVTDAIAELIANGLAHDLDGFLLASQAARSFDRLDL